VKLGDEIDKLTFCDVRIFRTVWFKQKFSSCTLQTTDQKKLPLW